MSDNNTSTALVSIDNMTPAQLMAFIGQGDEKREFKFPFLNINAAHENDEQKPIPAGTFTFTKDAKRWFSVKGEPVTFRVFLRVYQYSVYDEKEQKVVNRSRLIRSFNEEAYDEKGTIKCGKVSRKEVDKLTPAQKEKQEEIKCSQILYGVVGGNFECPATNEKQTLSNFPVIWRTNGSNFMSMGNAIDQLFSKNKPFLQVDMSITLRREKNGSVVYYVAEPTFDLTKPPVWDNERDLPVMKEFVELVNTANQAITDKYKEALANKKEDVRVAGVMAKVIDGDYKPLDNDFHDDSVDDIGRSSVLAAG